MRKFQLDAYRNLRDISLKVKANFDVNSVLLSCYDTAFLFADDIYETEKQKYIKAPVEPNLYFLVQVLCTRKFDLEHRLRGYDRFYWFYELVYHGYIETPAREIVHSMKVTQEIIRYWGEAIPIENIVELHNFIFPNLYDSVSRDYKNKKEALRGELLQQLGLLNPLDDIIARLEDPKNDKQ